MHLPIRPRRWRRTSALRELSAEPGLECRQLVQGHFVLPGVQRQEDIGSLPGISRFSADQLLPVVERDLSNGVKSVMLFGVPEHKDADGSGALDAQGEVPAAVRLLKQQFGDDLIVMVDVCLCPYTDHGHCGFVHGEEVVNDASVVALSQMAAVLAEAGADFVSPSDMMDGRIGAIRSALDDHGFQQTSILAYTAKYASAFYGPFRDAAGSAPSFGDRRSYQMDFRNRREAHRELELDLDEGADMVMVKPALAYLDIIRDFADASPIPVCAYNVSGEYAMVKMAAREGLAEERAMTLEVLGAIRRAGADCIITYHASQIAAAGWLR
ncbi:MAG: porphobilinogen synthase [Planctomycetes bacterium]|nr:porphobilinogen synthase [Planctomycetota bacterium]